ncbi:MAG TPA: hypothetical protein VLX09_25320 [Stellaceae bacterium]|nr:hypothetical protein [Stellaceae bacterium]
MSIMRTSYQALLSLTLGLAAAGAALWAPLPGGTPLDHILNQFLAIDDLRLVLSAGALVFGMSAIIAVAHSFTSGLRQVGQRAGELLEARPGGAISKRDWALAIAGTPFEEVAPILLPARRLPFLHQTRSEGDEIERSGTSEATTELLRLFWHRIARLQVWTATGVLFAVGVLSLIYRRLGLDGDGSLVMLILAPAGIVAIVICAALARLSVGRRIRSFFADLTGVAESDSVLRLTSEMRLAGADRDYPHFDPPLAAPPIEPMRPHDDGDATQDLRLADIPGAEDLGASGASRGAELNAALARILASIQRLEAQQLAASQDAAALRDVVRVIGDRPLPQPARDENGERIASLQSGLAEQMAALARVLASIQRLEAQQLAASKDNAALRDVVRVIADRPLPQPVQNENGEHIASLQSSLAELMVDMHTAQERVDRELAAFAGEMRDGRQHYQHAIGELASSLNRLEARLVPILRHVAATNRAMAMLSERAGRLEAQLGKFETELSQGRAATTAVVTPLRLQRSDEQAAEFADLTTELRQLLTELEDAAPSEPEAVASEPPVEIRAAP